MLLFSIYSNMLALCVWEVISILFVSLRQLHYSGTPVNLIHVVFKPYKWFV